MKSDDAAIPKNMAAAGNLLSHGSLHLTLDFKLSYFLYKYPVGNVGNGLSFNMVPFSNDLNKKNLTKRHENRCNV